MQHIQFARVISGDWESEVVLYLFANNTLQEWVALNYPPILTSHATSRDVILHPLDRYRNLDRHGNVDE